MEEEKGDFRLIHNPVLGINNANPISVEEFNDREDEELQQPIMLSLAFQTHQEPEAINPRKKLCTFVSSVTETGQSSNSSFTSDFLCQICLQSKPENQCLNTNGRLHSHCLLCMTRYVESKIQENVVAIRCPQTDCQCFLEPEFCRMFLPQQVFDRWCNALFESMMGGSQKIYCPFEECRAMLVNDGEMDVKQSECPYCRRLFCAQCMVPWHPGVDCGKFQDRGENVIEEVDGSVPSMEYVIEKSKGSVPSMMLRDVSNKTGFKLIAGSFYIPKEIMAAPEGEDAHFLCVEEQTFGIADGVGGWRKHGIDSGIYARQLMSNSKSIIEKNESRDDIDPLKVLKQAHSDTNAKGSSTACIVTLKNQTLHAVNVGDSGFMVIRKGQIAYRSPVQQSCFNCPYQLEKEDRHSYLDSAKPIEVPVEEGDVVVAGTDGLFDNMFKNEIAEVVTQGIAKGGVVPHEMAWNIAQLAMYNSFDHSHTSPFARESKRAGHKHHGGKVDDITVVVAYICN